MRKSPFIRIPRLYLSTIFLYDVARSDHVPSSHRTDLSYLEIARVRTGCGILCLLFLAHFLTDSPAFTIDLPWCIPVFVH